MSQGDLYLIANYKSPFLALGESMLQTTILSRKKETKNMIIDQVVLDYKKNGLPRLTFVVKNDGKQMGIIATKDKVNWKVYHIVINGEKIKKRGKLKEIIKKEIGTTFTGTRKEFIENIYKQEKNKIAH